MKRMRCPDRIAALHCLPLSVLLVCAATAQPPQMRHYQARSPLPVPDVGGYRTLKGDFHLHTVFSDGLVWPPLRVLEAWRDGLDVIALTDHADAAPPNKDILKPDLNLPYRLARAQAERHGIILIPGVEISPGAIHCNALFVKDANEGPGADLHAALRRMRAQGAFIFWNHPGDRWIPEIAAAHAEGLIHGVELVNEETFYPEIYPLVEEKKLTVFANSDMHMAMPAATESRRRPLTLLFVRTADEEGVREALFARRTAAWSGNSLWGPEEFLKGLWEGAVKVDPAPIVSRPPGGSVRVRFQNLSAIPFQIQVRNTPSWLHGGMGEVRAEGMYSHAMSIAADAPAGEHRIELSVEIVNLHIGPNRNLIVRVPVRINVVRR